MVFLRCGKCGTIPKVLVDQNMTHVPRYQVTLEPAGQIVGVNGVDVILHLHQPQVKLIGRRLDGCKLTGVTYGADRSSQICLGLPSQHKVFETELSQAAASKVLSALRWSPIPTDQRT